ncbi:hypothetical protein [Actinomadura sp. 7K507]|uniref:hypothetical protein n=1 Tax=Actinomadura sp. 7K507 TaxID=2530365 RepID=UPI00104E00A1|nr:hypothetical protein [Actinomadura sp. 7K507]TDC84159.1 hypothetical protein E1285_27430 [Actinomadura sp. 7K507]
MVRLDVGWPKGTWVAYLGCAIPALVLVNLVVGAIGLMFLTSSEFPWIGVVMMLPFLILDMWIALALAYHYKNAFWVDGRVLVQRALFGRRSHDLSAAQVSVETARPMMATWLGSALPRLVVRVPGRPPVKVWLRDPFRGGTLLPPHQLATLAQAIAPDLRHPVAHRLWTLASDPLNGII